MADLKISQLTGATTPVAGTEVLPIVQSSSTVKVSIANLTSGRSVDGSNFVVTATTVPVNGIYLPAANTVGIATNTTLRLSVSTTFVTSTIPLAAPLGSVTAPGYSFDGDPNTGIYSSAGDRLDFAVAGVRILNMTSNGSANYFQMYSSVSTEPVEILSAGSDSNVDIKFTPKGTGLVRFGAATGSVATVSTHQIGMKAADGTTYYLLATTVA